MHYGKKKHSSLFGMMESDKATSSGAPGGYSGVTRNLLIACCSGYVGALSFGYVIGYTSPALPLMPLSKEDASWFGSVVNFGALVGCLLGGFLVERVGRRGSLLCTTIPFCLGWGLIGVPSEVGLLFLGRFFTGIGSGMMTVVGPLFVAEIANKDLRGLLGSGIQLFITIGILMVNLLGMSCGWRLLAMIGFGIPVVGVLLLLRTPDSPRFYLAHRRKPEALRSLSFLRGQRADVEDECRDIEESLDTEEKVSWGEFLKPELLRPLRVSLGLMVFQQLTGINVVMFYTVSIFQSAGFKESGHLAAVVISAVQVVFTVVACVLMDKAGRRALLLLASCGMVITCFTMGLYYKMSNTSTTDVSGTVPDLSWLALSSLIVYIIAFSLGWGPIPMLMMSEIFPLKARGSAMALASLTGWSTSFLVTKEFAYLELVLGLHGTFWLFGIFTLIASLFVYKMVPETKGKSLEDIELYFLGRAIRGI